MLVACSGEEPSPSRSGGPAPVKVVTESVVRGPWIDTLEALGTARANESVTLTAKVTETVVRVNFEDGQRVEEGQLLVDLSGRAEVAALEEAQAAYTEALKQYERQADLVEQGTLSRSTLDSLVATRDAARARMEAIRARLADRVIAAPFAGVLGFRLVSQGTLVTPGTAIATLDDIDPIKLDFSVPETAMASVAEGQTIRARSAAFPEREFSGEVQVVGSRVDAVTRSVTVRAEIANPDGALRPGMLLTVKLELPQRETIAIPEIALIQVGTSQSVFTVDAEGRARQTEVRAGARKAGRVEIIEGLQQGDRLVTEGIVKLRPGTPVVEQPVQVAGG
nr:efflux RND transporter periplasmic adaptor subunit [Lysobacter sp. CAU 1642]